VKKIKITQVKSPIGYVAKQKATLKTLGLKRIGDSVIRESKPEFLGMAKSISHLVEVQEVK
jgi:large subunit ribosomal protein L30